ncbi:MAG: adenosylcobinamide-phosphate synthase CbiB [Clostridiales bacterium]|nr:adenosylcobinamide-phosphate synthase CbiB [Clostridiales bacterium]MCF8023396.1 adenosylcobinamide-phosphate synthase CbiB [Clostridiales bacterium]
MGIQVLLAYIIDLLVSDPKFIPHPVIIIGKFISLLERKVRKHFFSAVSLQVVGIVVVLITVLVTYAVTGGLLYLMSMFNSSLAYIAGVWLISTTIAPRGLSNMAQNIRILLLQEQLNFARKQVGMIVGRDSSCMNKSEVCRATVETVAENTVDAVISPLFYALILGPAGAMAYRAVNTLDSMLGYRNEEYADFGWAAARLDDAVNYIPARLTCVFMLIAVWITGRNIRQSIYDLKDAKKHPSPNAGIPESIIAGALDIRLGGLNYYEGQVSFRSYMGSGSSNIYTNHISSTIDIMLFSSFIFAAAGCLIFT